MTDAPEPTPAAPIGTAAVIAAWSGLDQMAQLVVGGSIAAIVLTILGLPFGTWGSTDFVLLVLAAAIVALVTAAMATTSRSIGPLALLETGAATVLAVLAVWNFIAILFHIGKLHDWKLVEDIPEGHPDQFDSMDTRERGLR